MNRPVAAALAAIAACLTIPGSAPAGEAEAAPRRVLVELYSSQGCDSCPPAADLMGRLGALGYGDDRVVALNFHVDYFNEPWADPFSDPAFSRRQASYNGALKREDLYFTPMLMVDGREPMLGSDRPKLLESLREAASRPPGVRLEATLEGAGARRSLKVALSEPGRGAAGRDLLVGVALTEDPVKTAVPSGENAGKTLVEHHVVRSFAHKAARLDRSGSKSLRFPLSLRPGQAARRTMVAVFAQDEANGEVHQAASLRWDEPAATPKSSVPGGDRPR